MLGAERAVLRTWTLAGVVLLATVLVGPTSPAQASDGSSGFRSGFHLRALQDEGDNSKGDGNRPEELWRLFPLDPLAGRTPTPTASPQPSSEPVAQDPPAGQEVPFGRDVRSQEVGGGMNAWLVVLLVLGALGLVGAAWLLRRRRPSRTAVTTEEAPVAGSPAPFEQPAGVPASPNGARRQPAPAVVPAAADRHEPPPDPAPSIDLRDAPAPISERPPNGSGEHVRVHLNDGRCIEGWKKDSRASNQQVLILDVEAVYDRGGEELASTPLDRFLLPPQIERIEHLD